MRCDQCQKQTEQVVSIGELQLGVDEVCIPCALIQINHCINTAVEVEEDNIRLATDKMKLQRVIKQLNEELALLKAQQPPPKDKFDARVERAIKVLDQQLDEGDDRIF